MKLKKIKKSEEKKKLKVNIHLHFIQSNPEKKKTTRIKLEISNN